MNLTKLIPLPTLSQSTTSVLQTEQQQPKQPTQQQEEDEEDEEDEILEPDSEVRWSPDPASFILTKTSVTHSILHSPTYLVPTLYITPSSTSPPITLTALTSLLVSSLHAPSLQNPSIGPLGALSPTTHPETGRSCLWIHPCLTQEGMKGLGLEGSDGVRYLLGWMGIVGAGVGFEVPVEVARLLLGEGGRGEECQGTLRESLGHC